MMNNLFSSFDPCTGHLSMNWISSMMIILMFPYSFWTTKSNSSLIISLMIKELYKEMKTLNKKKGSSLMFISLFFMILFINIMGILPYVFTSSSQLVFSMSLALPMWISWMMFGWINKTSKMLIHLVPMGTPYILMPLMVLIETISNLIRPGSLSVRLSANMIAGHIIMSLLGSNSEMIPMITLMVLFMILLSFESAVAIIQAYVFMTLSTLYSSEI
uniref:ATP synthase F0 subunit 6 n=1 Tax=Conlopa bredoni TaxID=3112144 RepID=UPI002E764635|nr:ATP synthase F0 subunit 6 [Conlopa bredoni]WRK21431.1 ATP synthase F0 subunit 6 [Conlopa bredoni]